MKTFNELAPLLPYGEQSFPVLRKFGQIYVDKTALLYDLTTTCTSVFLSRPRRFGKSTLVSTLEELFVHGVEPYDGHDSYFKGLAIEKLWHSTARNDGPFFLMHFDFKELYKNCRSSGDFGRNLQEAIWNYARQFDVKLAEEEKDSDFLLNYLLDALPDRSAVILIDEYDAPLTAGINEEDNDRSFKAAAELLSGFFNTIKIKSGKLRFVFITGITRFKDSSIFTAGNTIEDISQDPHYGTLCGLTREELKQYFPEHLQYAAANVCNKPASQVGEDDIEQLLEVMSEWYDGCCFDKKCSAHVFSTWSVLNFLKNRDSDFEPYWYDGGGFPAILRKALFGKNTVDTLEKIAAEDFSVSIQAFRNPVTLSTMDRSVLLFQTGYLTIKAPYIGPKATGSVRLGLPNREMKKSMKSLICSEFVKGGDESIVERIREPLRQAVRRQDAEGLKDCFNAVLLDIDHEHHFLQQESELCAYLKQFTYLALGVRVISSLHEARGKADMLFDLEDSTVVIEFKYVKKSDEQVLKNKLNEALSQIQDREYGKSLQSNPKLWRVGMVFSAADRMITHAAAVES